MKLYSVWDNDSRDWKDPPADEMIKKMVSSVQNGSITLFHVGKKNTVQALPEIIAQLKGKGYIFKTVGEIIYYDNFNIDVQGSQHKK